PRRAAAHRHRQGAALPAPRAGRGPGGATVVSAGGGRPPLQAAAAARELSQLERAERVLLKVRWFGAASWLIVLQRPGAAVDLRRAYWVYAALIAYALGAELFVRRRYIRATALATTLCDSTIVTLICLVTHGIDSDFYPYFYFTVLAGSLRFGVRETFL